MEKDSKKLTDEEAKELQKEWNESVDFYDKEATMGSLQSYITLMIHSQAFKKPRILEVAVGTGVHQCLFAT